MAPPPSSDDRERGGQARQDHPLARIVSWAHAGVDPAIMGTGRSRLRAQRSEGGLETLAISI